MLQLPPFSAEVRQELIARYKAEPRARITARLQCLLLKDEGYPHQEIAALLHVSSNTITDWLHLFLQEGLGRLCHLQIKGKEAALSQEQRTLLGDELARQPYSSAKEVAEWVKERWGVAYSERGMQALLKREGFTRQQSRLVPGKADPAEQAFFCKSMSD